MIRTIPYRIIGAIFIFLGGLPLLIAVFHHAPWWFYFLPFSLLIPGFIIALHSDGALIDVDSGIVEKWWQVYRLKWYQQSRLTDIKLLYLNFRALQNRTGGVVYEVILKDDNRRFKAYSAYEETDARRESERISALTGIPESPPPEIEFTMRQAVILVAVILTLPVVMLACLLIYQAVK